MEKQTNGFDFSKIPGFDSLPKEFSKTMKNLTGQLTDKLKDFQPKFPPRKVLIDGEVAWVTLSENNSIRIDFVDLKNAKIFFDELDPCQ